MWLTLQMIGVRCGVVCLLVCFLCFILTFLSVCLFVCLFVTIYPHIPLYHQTEVWDVFPLNNNIQSELSARSAKQDFRNTLRCSRLTCIKSRAAQGLVLMMMMKLCNCSVGGKHVCLNQLSSPLAPPDRLFWSWWEWCPVSVNEVKCLNYMSIAPLPSSFTFSNIIQQTTKDMFMVSISMASSH